MASVVRLRVDGLAGPDLVGRVTGLVAQRGLVPISIAMRRQGDDAWLIMVLDGLEPSRAAHLADRIREMVVVREVELRFEPQPEEGYDDD